MQRIQQHYGVGTRDTARIEAFSDAVIAIAITLLILEIDIPSVQDVEGESSLWHELLHLWPSYLGYLISFLVIGIMWANHHNIFRHIKSVDHYLVVINTVLLLCIAFLPFPTAILAEHLTHNDERAAATFYAGWFFVTALAFNLLWRYPTKIAPNLLEPDVDPAEIAAITRRFNFGPPIYLAATVVSFLWPNLGLLMLLGLAILYLLPMGQSRSSANA